MGTLFNQSPRKYWDIDKSDAISFIEVIQEVSSDSGLSTAEVLKAYEILELNRRNNLYVANGDIHDEQMMGIGEILKELASSISELADREE